MTISITSISLFLSLLGAATAAPSTDGPVAPRASSATPPPAAGIASTPAPAPAAATASTPEPSPAWGRPPSPATLPPPSDPAAAASAADTPTVTWSPYGGFALELGTGGLSGAIGGSLGLGWGLRGFQIGVAFDVTHSDLSSQQFGSDNLGHLTTTALAVGPWVRWAVGHTRDGRVDAIGAIDFQYSRMSVDERNGNTGIGNSGAADGVVLRAGPGVRFWATPWLALSYTAQLTLADLSGPLVAFTGASGAMQGPLNYSFSDVQVGLAGRLSILAVF